MKNSSPKKLLGDNRSGGPIFTQQDGTPASPGTLALRPVHSADSRASSSTGYLGTNEFIGDMIGDPQAAADAIALFNKTFNLTGGSTPEERAASMCSFTRYSGQPDFNLYDKHRGPSLSQGPSGMCRNKNFEPNYEDGAVISWYMDSQNAAPAYISDAHNSLTRAVESCFSLWKDALSQCGIQVTFQRKPPAEEGKANVKITFQDRSNDNLMAYSGTGGELAHASANFIRLDQAQHWRLQGTGEANPLHATGETGMHDINKTELFPVLEPVLVHLIGHVLGLGNSPRPEDAMYPYYNPSAGDVSISDGDKEQLAKLYGKRGRQ